MGGNQKWPISLGGGRVWLNFKILSVTIMFLSLCFCQKVADPHITHQHTKWKGIPLPPLGKPLHVLLGEGVVTEMM